MRRCEIYCNGERKLFLRMQKIYSCHPRCWYDGTIKSCFLRVWIEPLLTGLNWLFSLSLSLSVSVCCHVVFCCCKPRHVLRDDLEPMSSEHFSFLPAPLLLVIKRAGVEVNKLSWQRSVLKITTLVCFSLSYQFYFIKWSGQLVIGKFSKASSRTIGWKVIANYI